MAWPVVCSSIPTLAAIQVPISLDVIHWSSEGFSHWPPPEPLLQCVARESFWDFEVGYLRKLCSHLGIDGMASSKVFDVLLALVTHVLGLTEAGALNIMAKTVAKLDMKSCSGAQQLLAVDDGIELLVKAERETSSKKNDKWWSRLSLSCQIFASPFALPRPGWVMTRQPKKKCATLGGDSLRNSASHGQNIPPSCSIDLERQRETRLARPLATICSHQFFGSH